MFRVFDKQSNGKTKKLLVFAKQNNCTVICSFPSRMQDKAIRYGIGSINCISYEEFLTQYVEHRLEKLDYVIDEPEKLLILFFQNGATLQGYDMTTEY